MKDEDKTKKQIINKMAELRQRLGGFEILESGLKWAEDQLRESKVFTENLVAYMKDGFFVLDNQGVHLDVNTALCQMTGFTREELIGTQPPHPYWPEEAYEEMLIDFQRTARGEFKDFELIFKRKNGEHFPVIVSPSQIGDKEGNVVGYFAIVKDITERRQAEEELWIAEQNFYNSLENSPLGVRIVTTEGELLYANQAILDIYGYSSVEELKAVPAKQRYTPESYAEHQERKEKRKLGKPIPSNYEISIVRKDGEIRHLAVSRKAVVWDGDVQFQVVYEDITERKEAERVLRESERNYKELAESITDIFFAMNDELRYTYWNRASEELTGIPAKDALGKHLYDIFSNVEVTRRAEKMYRKVLRTKQPQHFMNEYKLAGKDFIFEISAYPSATGLSVFVKDITERKQLEREVAEYEELNKLKSNLLSTVSHELRTPMATIKGYSTMLLDYDKRLRHDEKHQYLRTIDKATDRLTDLVDHLLDMSRLDAGLFRLNIAPVRIDLVVSDLVNEAQIRLQEYALRTEFKGEPLTLKVDGNRIRQVMDNLLDNASKYSDSGTEIVVRLATKADEVEISVSDQGRGIPPEDLERVFDRMYRIERRLSTDPGGMGLGLALCKALVEAHGGRIWVESIVRKGSTFHFTLPIETTTKR